MNPFGWLKLGEKAYDAFQLQKARRIAKRVSKRLERALEDNGMGNYSKLIGAAVGWLAGLAVTNFPFLAPLLTTETVDQLVVLVTTALSVYLFPSNKPA